MKRETQGGRRRKEKRGRKRIAVLALAAVLTAAGKAEISARAQEEVTLNVMLRYDFEIPDDFEMVAERQMRWHGRKSRSMSTFTPSCL